MPIIQELTKLPKLEKELREENPGDIRKWTIYVCEKCDHAVGSDIEYESLRCILCGNIMKKRN